VKLAKKYDPCRPISIYQIDGPRSSGPVDPSTYASMKSLESPTVARSDDSSRRRLIILGIRGIPAAHGGFETFAERLAIWLRDHGWEVTVYCQGSDTGERTEDEWEGIRRVHLPIKTDGAIGTIEFDVKATADALREPGTILTLGYNTGFLCVWLRLRCRLNYVNMDGLEWKRAKYSFVPRLYLWINERLAAWAGSRLIADHPAIAEHLATRTAKQRISVIPYGSDSVSEADADPTPLARMRLEPGRFFTVIARPEPENSILEIVTAFSAKPRGAKLALLGKYDKSIPYQAAVAAAASAEVVFTGPIYDKPSLAALRFHSLAYLHGHQVGGTNPSLVEALGAGNAVIAHDNTFNRWVAGEAGLYFSDAVDCAKHIEQIIADASLRQRLSAKARQRWQEDFTWPNILEQYRTLLTREID
jgi:glycosyltransferase involved in cell wall biosynthesis